MACPTLLSRVVGSGSSSVLATHRIAKHIVPDPKYHITFSAYKLIDKCTSENLYTNSTWKELPYFTVHKKNRLSCRKKEAVVKLI